MLCSADRIRLTGPAATKLFRFQLFANPTRRNCDADLADSRFDYFPVSGEPRFIRIVDWQLDSGEAKRFLIFGRWQILNNWS